MRKIDTIIKENWNIIKLISIILSFVIGLSTLDNYINNQIENRITNKSFISQLTKELRPFLITDGNGVIIYDNGASKYIKTIKISKDYQKVDIQFKKFIKNCPILSPVGAIEFTYRGIRKKKFSWSFTNTTKTQMMVHDKPQAKDLRFIIDILPS